MLHRKETAKLLRLYRLCSGFRFPNIIGTLSTNMVHKSFQYTGALSQTNEGTLFPSSAEQNGRAGLLSINAKRVSSFYGQSTTVQPAALQILIIIKVWMAPGWTVVALPNKELPLLAFIFKTTWWSLSPAWIFEFNWLTNVEVEKQPA